MTGSPEKERLQGGGLGPDELAARAEEEATGLVEIARTEDAAEAEELAAHLRAADVAAIAKPRLRTAAPHGGAWLPFAVVVPLVEAGRAGEVLAALQPREGEASDEEIERILRGEDEDEHEERDEDGGEPARPTTVTEDLHHAIPRLVDAVGRFARIALPLFLCAILLYWLIRKFV